MLPPVSYMPANAGKPPAGNLTPPPLTLAACGACGSFVLADALLTRPNLSSSSPIPAFRLSSGCITIFSPSASACPNALPFAAALSSSAAVDCTGVSRSLNQPNSACTLSPIHWNTGWSGENASLMGPAAARKPSTTPPKYALIGAQYFQITSATPASAATASPTGLSSAPSAQITPVSTVRSRVSGDFTSHISAPPAPRTDAASGAKAAPASPRTCAPSARTPAIGLRKDATSVCPAACAFSLIFSSAPSRKAFRMPPPSSSSSPPRRDASASRIFSSQFTDSPASPPLNSENSFLMPSPDDVRPGASFENALPSPPSSGESFASPFRPSMFNPKRSIRIGPSTAAMPTASVPSASVTVATTAAIFISLPTSSGLDSTQRRMVPVTRFTASMISISGARSVSPRLLSVLAVPVFTSSHCAESESLLMSDSFCMEPLAALPCVSCSWRRSSGMLLASFAASLPNSLPNTMVIAVRRLSAGRLFTFSSTRWMVPIASVVICFSMAFGSSFSSSMPPIKVLPCMVATESSRTMAFAALAAVSDVAPRLRNVEPSAAALR